MRRFKKNGFLLLPTVLSAIVSIMLATSFFVIYGGQFSMVQNARTALQAQQYAEYAANSLKLLPYDELKQHGRQAITDISGAEGWQDEITLSPEKTIGESGKQRIAEVKIYKDGDALSRYSLQIPLSSQGSTSSGVPIGAVIAWPIASDPTESDRGKWLECDGQLINAAKYPKLAAIMERTPDYQGIFLRGLGSQYSDHYGAVLHQSGDLGELQGDAIRNITGSFGCEANKSGITGNNPPTGAFYYQVNNNRHINSATDPGNEKVVFDVSRITPTSNEIRVANRAVRWLIRAA